MVLKWYKDTLGKWTGGYGHLRTAKDTSPVITQAIADAWLDEDLEASSKAADEQVTQMPFYTEEFREVLISVNYQLGTSWFLKFPKTWKLMKEGRYNDAAWEAADSAWYKQTPVRVMDLQRALWRLECQYEIYNLIE